MKCFVRLIFLQVLSILINPVYGVDSNKIAKRTLFCAVACAAENKILYFPQDYRVYYSENYCSTRKFYFSIFDPKVLVSNREVNTKAVFRIGSQSKKNFAPFTVKNQSVQMPEHVQLFLFDNGISVACFWSDQEQDRLTINKKLNEVLLHNKQVHESQANASACNSQSGTTGLEGTLNPLINALSNEDTTCQPEYVKAEAALETLKTEKTKKVDTKKKVDRQTPTKGKVLNLATNIDPKIPVYFLVDTSGSMEGDKLNSTITLIGQAIKDLPSTQSVNVVLMDGTGGTESTTGGGIIDPRHGADAKLSKCVDTYLKTKNIQFEGINIARNSIKELYEKMKKGGYFGGRTPNYQEFTGYFTMPYPPPVQKVIIPSSQPPKFVYSDLVQASAVNINKLKDTIKKMSGTENVQGALKATLEKTDKAQIFIISDYHCSDSEIKGLDEVFSKSSITNIVFADKNSVSRTQIANAVVGSAAAVVVGGVALLAANRGKGLGYNSVSKEETAKILSKNNHGDYVKVYAEGNQFIVDEVILSAETMDRQKKADGDLRKAKADEKISQSDFDRIKSMLSVGSTSSKDSSSVLIH